MQQSIDRTPGFDANWGGIKLDLLTDWIGADSRTANGGNGNFDGEGNGTPTTMLFTLSDLPPGTYNWRSFHHDTEQINTVFRISISTDGGATFSEEMEFRMTSSTGNANPPADELFDGVTNPDSGDPADLSSTVNLEFIATGDDVVIRFVPLAEIAVHRQLVGCNGFELTQLSSGGVPFRIEELVYDADFREFTLFWNSTPGDMFLIRASNDLVTWIELDDGLVADSEVTNFTETLPDPIPATRFYTVEKM